jgi:hypothetical protein
MEYRCEATSLEGFVQQLASNILPHGYWFYVTGRVPDGKDPQAVDEKLIAKYGVALSRQQRARRKVTGAANVHYLRFGRRWVLLATHGHHRFFEEEGGNIRDARKVPIQIEGYSLSVKHGNFLRKEEGEEAATPDGRLRVRVQIGRERYKELRDYFLSIACHRSAETLSRELFLVPYEPYAPVRRQLLNILRMVNDQRKAAGFSKVPPTVLRYKRRIVKPFERGERGDRSYLAEVNLADLPMTS